MNVAVGLMDGLGLDGDRCIRVIPRHPHFMIIGTGTMCFYLDHTINYCYVQVMLNKQFQLRLQW